MVKGDSYSFVYKLLETMKQMVDAQNPDDSEINKNIYCTCDLALGLLAKKVSLRITCSKSLLVFLVHILYVALVIVSHFYLEAKSTLRC